MVPASPRGQPNGEVPLCLPAKLGRFPAAVQPPQLAFLRGRRKPLVTFQVSDSTFTLPRASLTVQRLDVRGLLRGISTHGACRVGGLPGQSEWDSNPLLLGSRTGGTDRETGARACHTGRIHCGRGPVLVLEPLVPPAIPGESGPQKTPQMWCDLFQ